MWGSFRSTATIRPNQPRPESPNTQRVIRAFLSTILRKRLLVPELIRRRSVPQLEQEGGADVDVRDHAGGSDGQRAAKAAYRKSRRGLRWASRTTGGGEGESAPHKAL